tara:strand:+ start:111 stop:743 length:633 start_codon:yes stop_codon:yes gene_type:complete
MTDNIEERLNDEGFVMNRGFDSEEGYRILRRLGVPPSMEANGMGVGEYNDNNFYSKMMENAKVIDDGDEEEEEEEDEPEKYELNNGDENMIGYISNEIYYPIQKDKKEIKVEKNADSDSGVMGMRVGELFENTSTILNNFDDDFLRSLHKVDMEFGYSRTDKDIVNNIKRYVMAFMVYLQDGNNILYIGITLFIISIILYFINIIRRTND